jgi:DNA-binding FadR family transcriptional regulator
MRARRGVRARDLPKGQLIASIPCQVAAAVRNMKHSNKTAVRGSERVAASKTSVVSRVTEAIRRDCMVKPDGAFLGSEDELVERYGASRPTLRHAASVIAQEQLLSIKRGVGGGYFVRRPKSDVVAHMVATYLRMRMVAARSLFEAFTPIRNELAQEAARNPREQDFAALKKFVDDETAAKSEPMTLRSFLKSEREFGKIMIDLSGNHVLSLFFDTLLDLAGMLERQDDIFINRPARIEQYRSQRSRLASAILQRDEHLCKLEANRMAAISGKWLTQDSSKNGMLI